MKYVFGLTLFILFSCQIQEKNIEVDNLSSKQTLQPEISLDELYELNIDLKENFVGIKKLNGSDYPLPDNSVKTEPYKFGDFNADNKEDVLVYLGACGTGGCMYGLFVKEHKNYYRLAYMDYLKSPEFITESNGYLSINSYEEAEAYDPSKLHVSKFTFDVNSYQYELDTTYIFIDK